MGLIYILIIYPQILLLLFSRRLYFVFSNNLSKHLNSVNCFKFLLQKFFFGLEYSSCVTTKFNDAPTVNTSNKFIFFNFE